MHAKLTKTFVAKAQAVAGTERSIWWDENMESFGLMVTAAGHRSFIVQYRVAGRSRRYTIKANQSLAKARKQAKSVLGSVAEGRDPVVEKRHKKAEEANTLKAVAEEYLRREEQKKELRSIGERRRIFERNIYPKLGSRQIDSIRRSEIVRLLDRIEDDSGASMADHVLAVLRRLMSWHASRSDDFRSPITRGMAKTKPKERARERVLSDDEVRAVWRAATTFPGPYGHLVKFILLTATRRREAANMRRQEVTGSRWLIPAARHKSKSEFLLPLSKDAQAVLAEIPVIAHRGWVFTTDGERPIAGFSKFKRQFDEHVLSKRIEQDADAKPFGRWTTHDLRRTARSLMSRAGVSPDHAERALGHVIGGVRGTYDRHAFELEKAQAFEALATTVASILAPNVVSLRRVS
jgi:integrase